MIDRMTAVSGSRTAEDAAHNVPVSLTSLIGRSRELDGIGEVLRRTPLVTVTGPGGVGKTRLAIEVARRRIGDGRTGSGWWISPRAPIPPPRWPERFDVGGRSATAPTESLRRYLADRDLLLVMDNCARRRSVRDARILTAVLVRRPPHPGDQP
jgi:hypothetical protein